MKRVARLLGAVALLASAAVQAAQYRDFDDYRVHYSAFNSTIIAPSVAQAYDLQRSSYRGILNVAVQKRGSEAVWPSAAAEVRATATNLAGQVRRIEVRRIEEGKAVYYIGEFPVTHRERLNFDVEVTPEGAGRSYNLSFDQQFFTRETD
jgi:hypothetical protein